MFAHLSQLTSFDSKGSVLYHNSNKNNKKHPVNPIFNFTRIYFSECSCILVWLVATLTSSW